MSEISVHKSSPSRVWTKRLIWLYFWLLIVEGALRRWILPGLAGPLLLIREPVAVAILLAAASSGSLRVSGLLIVGYTCGILSFVLTFICGHGNLLVAAYGLRIFILHWPLIFVIEESFDRGDVNKMISAICWIGFPMTVLIAAQFFLPQSHWINIGVGGEGTAGFSGAADRFRPPGTFSFTLGVSQFYSLYAAVVAAVAYHQNATETRLWRGSVVALIMAIPLTVSRSVLFSIFITGSVFIVTGATNPRLARRFVTAGVVAAVLGGATALTPAFSTAMEAFSGRWNGANDAEGGVGGVFVDRFLGGLWAALSGAQPVPLGGFGLGMGTNVGATLLTGSAGFLIAEGEWGRMVGEMGPLLGILFIGARMALAFRMFNAGYQRWQSGDPCALLLGSVVALWIAQGNWAQPTSLGFSVIGGGLCLAASVAQKPPRAVGERVEHLLSIASAVRGRSIYGEALHHR